MLPNVELNKIEHRYAYSNKTIADDYVIKSSEGFLRSIVVNSTSAGSLKLYDAGITTKFAAAIDLTNTPPGVPGEGDIYLTNNNPTGAWATHPYSKATYSGGSWTFVPATSGTAGFTLDDGALNYFDGSSWTIVSPFATLKSNIVEGTYIFDVVLRGGLLISFPNDRNITIVYR